MDNKTGILLISLGTPDGSSPNAVRRYLKEFLSDRRVIEKGGPLWWLILNGIILLRRSKELSRAYSLIWNTECDESPLKTIGRAQVENLAAKFAAEPGVRIDWDMRYGALRINDAIANLAEAGCRRLPVHPLYPQYSATAAGTTMDKVFDCLRGMCWQAAIRTVPPYFSDPSDIGALAKSVADH